jgi:hypothetical protein
MFQVAREFGQGFLVAQMLLIAEMHAKDYVRAFKRGAGRLALAGRAVIALWGA